ncbi:chloride channel protein [Psychromarinibacter sp. C21-152]|uniref:Chloride channel protein n=1 Tax=Psychromarinibacter sediminicola TaxID=3033385 RepID=A0AAE3NS18_9RHOB|nr:chloride channel protein [Psychromarinibacter sediminicola]MDF0601386.1 chloride channel protein [Psychromarinibacter sediminicola]
MRRSRENATAGPALRMLVLTGAALAIGTLAAFAAIALVEIVSALNSLLLVDPRARVQWERQAGIVTAATLLVPTIGGLLVGLAHRHLSPDGRPLGPPDVIRAVQFRAALPPARSGLVSTATAALSLGVGASVGQYGPMVYLGAMIGGVARRLRLGVPNLAAIAVSCGVAAAISTAFNAPIAGLVFAHEVVLRHYATQAFAPVAVASATGYVIANVIFDRPALFLIQFAGVSRGHEFVLFAVLGILVALAAVGFMRLLLATGPRLALAVARPELRPALAGLAVGTTALALPDVLGIGAETLRFTTIEGAFGMAELVVLVAAKIVLTALCIGAGFSGGVFSPALLIGSLMGALFWTLATGVAGVATSGVAVYAICGMMAFASSVIGAPLTCVLIVFELTRSYDVTIAAMVAVVFANLVSHRLFGRSLFDVQLAGRGVDLSLGREWARLAALRVLDLVRDDAVVAETGEAPDAVADRLSRQGWRQAFVAGPDGRFAGVFTPGAPAATVGDAARPPTLTFDETTDVAGAMERLRGFVGDAVPVVDSASGRLLGVVSEADVVAAWLDESERLRKEENASL